MTERVVLAGLPSADVAALLARVAAARLVCFPTDTVYGLGGAPRAEVVDALLRAKGRDDRKPLQLVFPKLATLLDYLSPPPPLARALARLLPGRVTAVVPAPAAQAWPPPGHRVDGLATVGVRVPAWPPAAEVLGRLPCPLVASSANESGERAARSLHEVPPRLLARCDMLLDAGSLPGTASTVIDLTDYAVNGEWRILREGALSEAAASAALDVLQGASGDT